MVASAQLMFAVCQKTRSQKNAAIKNAIGNEMNIGWIGWPAMLAVLRGFRVRGAIVIFTPSNFVGLSRLTRLSHGFVKLYTRFAGRSQASIGRRNAPVTTAYVHRSRCAVHRFPDRLATRLVIQNGERFSLGESAGCTRNHFGLARRAKIMSEFRDR